MNESQIILGIHGRIITAEFRIVIVYALTTRYSHLLRYRVHATHWVEFYNWWFML